MFGIDSAEFLLIVIVAVVVIGPKDLPRALYKVGQVVGKAQAMARHFRTGIDAMVREVELEELEKKWAAQNERIMSEHAAPPPALIEMAQAEEGQAEEGQTEAGHIETGQIEAPQAEPLRLESPPDTHALPVQSAFPYDAPAQPAPAPAQAVADNADGSPASTQPKDGAAA
ncbi:translocase [Sphingobium aquiterrae]|uniref:translocase n=1 Tax=Sphingobium aquiterrae TaxID=2038656 RepID=UPI00301772D3